MWVILLAFNFTIYESMAYVRVSGAISSNFELNKNFVDILQVIQYVRVGSTDHIFYNRRMTSFVIIWMNNDWSFIDPRLDRWRKYLKETIIYLKQKKIQFFLVELITSQWTNISPILWAFLIVLLSQKYSFILNWLQ